MIAMVFCGSRREHFHCSISQTEGGGRRLGCTSLTDFTRVLAARTRVGAGRWRVTTPRFSAWDMEGHPRPVALDRNCGVKGCGLRMNRGCGQIPSIPLSRPICLLAHIIMLHSVASKARSAHFCHFVPEAFLLRAAHRLSCILI